MAWSRVQSAGSSGFSAASFAVAYGSNVSSGTKLIAVSSVIFTTTSSVKDGAGNSFTKIAAVGFNGATGNGELSLWAIDTPAGDVGTKPTITATYAVASGGQGLVIQEVSGLAAGNTIAAMIDGTPGTNSGLSGTGTLASPTYSSSIINEYLVACYGDDGASGANTWTAPTGYTADPNGINSSTVGNDAISYKNSTGGAESGGYSLAGGNPNDWAQILCAFKLAAAAGTPAPFTLPRQLRGRAAARKGTLTSIQRPPPVAAPGQPAPFHAPHSLLRGAAAAVRGKLASLRGRAGIPAPFRPPGSPARGWAAARRGQLAAVAAPPPVLHPVVVSTFKAPGLLLRGPAAARPGKLAAIVAPPPVLHPAVASPFKPPAFPLRGPAAARRGTLTGAAAPPPVIHPAVPAPFFPPRTLLRGPVPVRARTPLTQGAGPPPPPPPVHPPHWQGSTHMIAASAAGNLIQGARHTGTGGPGDPKGDYQRSGD